MSIAQITPAMARRIEIWPVDRLRPMGGMADAFAGASAQIAASIAEFGFLNPILVDSRAGIVAGHGRLLAAQKLGLAEVPVVVLDHLSETQRRAYVIADNKLAMNAGWDDAVLADELREIKADGLDLALVGFSDEELDVLLGRNGGAGSRTHGRGGHPGSAGPARHSAWRRMVDWKPPAALRRLPGLRRCGEPAARWAHRRGC